MKSSNQPGGPVDAILSRRGLLRGAGLGVAGMCLGRSARADEPSGVNAIEFQEQLTKMREEFYRHPKVDVIAEGFRPVGGKCADFAVAELKGRYHFYYIERRLQEGTPFYPGHEIFFGHASTANFLDWEVHEPVMLVRPGTWEESHVWAPAILRRGNEYVMAYTGVNRHISQNIGLASSTDLFEWHRWESNPISPARDRDWSAWRSNGPASCRDPEMIEHDGRIWMNYTATTREGASCIALCSSADLKTWKDHGPILVGPASGYEPKLEGGHRQGALESASLQRRQGKWFLIIKNASPLRPWRQGIIPSDRIDRFDFADGWEFWKQGVCLQVFKDRGDKSLIAGMVNGFIKFAEVDWSIPRPVATPMASKEALLQWVG